MGLLHALSSREVVIGLDVTDGFITAARVTAGADGGLRLAEAAWGEVSPVASDDEVAGAIRQMWRRHRLSTVTVAASTRNRALALKLFSYPGLRPEELPGALLLEAEETLQLPPGDIVVDWHVNSDSGRKGDAVPAIEGVSVAVARRQVALQHDMLKAAGLFPVVLDVPCLALANLFRACGKRQSPDEVVCVVSVATQCADIAVVSDGGGVYPRSVFERPNVPGGALEYFAECIKDVLAYYHFKLRLPAVDRVLVTGRRADAMADLLATVIDVPAAVWDPCRTIDSQSLRARRLMQRAPADLGTRMACALGLALRGEG